MSHSVYSNFGRSEPGRALAAYGAPAGSSLRYGRIGALGGTQVARAGTAYAAKGKLDGLVYRASAALKSVAAVPASTQGPAHRAEHFETAVQILITKRLRRPLRVIISRDGDGYLAQSVDFNLYGFAESVAESIVMLRREVESLHEDLQGEGFSDEWLAAKALLDEIVIPL